jgi:D-erythro-7,8-dihydroneopterin triphosphate epimerase
VRHTIFIKDMVIRCIVGVRPHERGRTQPLRVSVSLDADLPEAGRRDELDATVDYSVLHDRIVALVEASSFGLIETLAARVLEECFSDPRVSAAEVTVEKPNALPHGACSGVTVRRGRGKGPEEAR